MAFLRCGPDSAVEPAIIARSGGRTPKALSVPRVGKSDHAGKRQTIARSARGHKLVTNCLG